MIKEIIECAIIRHNKLNKTNYFLEENVIIIKNKSLMSIELYKGKKLVAAQKTYDLTYYNIYRAYITLFNDIFSCGLANLSKI